VRRARARTELSDDQAMALALDAQHAERQGL